MTNNVNDKKDFAPPPPSVLKPVCIFLRYTSWFLLFPLKVSKSDSNEVQARLLGTKCLNSFCYAASVFGMAAINGLTSYCLGLGGSEFFDALKEGGLYQMDILVMMGMYTTVFVGNIAILHTACSVIPEVLRMAEEMRWKLIGSSLTQGN